MSLSRLFLVIAAATFGCSSGTSVSTEPAPGTTEPGSGGTEPAASSLVSGKAAASGGASSDPAGISRQVIELRYDMTATYRDLELRLMTLSDARCPIGVTCIWAGQILATVEVTHSSQGVTEVELLRRVGRDPEVAKAFGYEFRLVDMDPHPKEGKTPDRDDYRVRIEVAAP